MGGDPLAGGRNPPHTPATCQDLGAHGITGARPGGTRPASLDFLVPAEGTKHTPCGMFSSCLGIGKAEEEGRELKDLEAVVPLPPAAGGALSGAGLKGPQQNCSLVLIFQAVHTLF